MLQAFSNWLVETWISHLFADRIWTVVISQTIHIVGVAVVMMSVALINLRILGVTGRNQSVASITSQLVPWVWWAMLALLLTGILQTFAEPAREIMNLTMRIKILMLIAVSGITYYYTRALRTDPHFWDVEGEHRTLGVTLALLSIALWVAIVVCGRLVAYVGAIIA
jgi:hypothetical protein